MKEDIIFELEELVKTIHREFHEKDKSIPKKSPTLTQLKILEYMNVHQNEKVYQRDLEDVLNVRRATVSEVLKTMEKNGFVKKTIDKDDLRSYEIKITNEAKKAFTFVNNKKNELNKILTQNIKESELETFAKVGLAMQKNLKEFANDKTN